MKVHSNPLNLLFEKPDKEPAIPLTLERSNAIQEKTSSQTSMLLSDTVELSPEAKRVLTRADIHCESNIDWETRTFKDTGKPISDRVHNAPTEAMLNGMQHYLVAYSPNGEATYVETDESETDRGLRTTGQMLANWQESLARQEKDLDELSDAKSDNRSLKDATLLGLGRQEVELRRFLSDMQQTMLQFNTNMDYARSFILEISEGKVDLHALFAKYLSETPS